MTLILDLSRLRTGVERVERRYEPRDLGDVPDDFRVAAPVALTAEARKDAQKVRLTGRVTTVLECACSRCLETLTLPVDSTFDLLFLPATAVEQRADEQEVADDDVGVSYYRDDSIDLGDVLREQFYLVLPMKPLCREDCRGLCPICGANRNRETCTCQADWIDPRLDALRQFKSKSSKAQ